MGKSIAKRNAEWTRSYGSQERVLWISQQRSVVSGKTPCVNAHVRTGGIARKADCRWIVPLTFVEHNELHSIGQKSFEKKYRIDLKEKAEETEKAWQNRLDDFE